MLSQNCSYMCVAFDKICSNILLMLRNVFIFSRDRSLFDKMNATVEILLLESSFQ